MGKIGDETHSKLVEERAAAQKRLDIVRGEHSGKKDKHPDVILAEKKAGRDRRENRKTHQTATVGGALVGGLVALAGDRMAAERRVWRAKLMGIGAMSIADPSVRPGGWV